MRHSKQRPHHLTAVLETPPRSKGPPLSQEHNHKSILGGNRKRGFPRDPDEVLSNLRSWGSQRNQEREEETSSYQEEELLLLRFSD